MNDEQKTQTENVIEYEIDEIFDSVQGEGYWLGTPATFIRFSGCNLRCSWCDTKNSWEKGTKMNVESIIKEINKDIIILTGGEPTIQDLEPLISHIRKINGDKHVKIMIETNGTNEINYNLDWITCSPKPDSDYIIKCKPNELKYVEDTSFSIKVIPKKYLGKIPIWIQPNGQDLQNSMKRCYKLVIDNKNIRLGLQLHKIYDIK